jgi:hypothetical protein
VGMLSCFGGMEKKKGSDWETVGALGARFSPLHPQYDCFFGYWGWDWGAAGVALIMVFAGVLVESSTMAMEKTRCVCPN